ncbi:hypothetical protein DFP73DRAFT_537067, partial [Morchella snyderi]
MKDLYLGFRQQNINEKNAWTDWLAGWYGVMFGIVRYYGRTGVAASFFLFFNLFCVVSWCSILCFLFPFLVSFLEDIMIGGDLFLFSLDCLVWFVNCNVLEIYAVGCFFYL